MKNTVVSVEHLSFSYNGYKVLQDVSLIIEENDFVSIVGPNAGGKTTLLKLILGLLKPQSGRISVFGLPPVKARSRIGYMPQYISLDPLFPVDVLDVVLMGRLGNGSRFGMFNKADKLAAFEALKKVEMYPYRHLSFSDLSGGQRQRVLIARALVSEPKLLLLDEPTANVDAAIETEFYEILNTLNQKMTIALVTHDLGFVSRYVKKVVCVNKRVIAHPTSKINGAVINELYGCDMHMVRHDTILDEENISD
ncbi:MAG: ABC transporter ATP-binding protein [Deltaproteobacteria bacterium]|nr:ABC transporter ATP-binding protein [Deltaproteobacteria bacterium]